MDFLSCDKEETIDVRIYEEVPNGIHFDSMENYHEFFSRNDITTMTYFYSKNHTLSKTGAFFLYKLDNKLDYIGKIAFIDCDRVKQRDIKLCNMKDTNGEILYPRMKISIPPKEKFNPITKKIEAPEEKYFSASTVSTETLFQFFTDNMISHCHEITESNLKGFLSTQNMNKVLIFLGPDFKPGKDKADNELNNILKGMSNIFYDRILIGNVTDPDVCESYGIDSFPKIMVFTNSFFRKERPTQKLIEKELTPKTIYEILNSHSLKEKAYLRRLYEMTLLDIKVFTLFPSTYHVFLEKFVSNRKIIIFSKDDSTPSEMNNFIQTVK